jgi:porphobilinogen synthase
MPDPLDLPIRPRRLRLDPRLRKVLQRVTLRRSDIIVPVFVREGTNIRQEVASMPGVFQMSVDVALPCLSKRAEEGFGAYLIFGVIDRQKKDASGSPALDENNIVCQLLRAAEKQKLPMIGITDLCFCEYTSHGHCGPMTEDGSTVRNDETVALLVKQALNHARAGAKIIAPSGMMDGTVGSLRRGLDDAGFADVSLLSYSVKYASAFYGPFRDAADSAPAFGDRRSYQMDAARGIDEALLEAHLDIEQGRRHGDGQTRRPVSRCDSRGSRDRSRTGGGVSGERRIFDDRGGRPQRVGRSRSHRAGVADRDQARGCRSDYHVLRRATGQAAGRVMEQRFSHYPAIPPPISMELWESGPQPCPYLPGRESRMRALMTRRLASEAYHAFMDANFRRSGSIIYQPSCAGCRACQSLRVIVPRFVMSKSQRRSWRKKRRHRRARRSSGRDGREVRPLSPLSFGLAWAKR